jgi:hypothetical protein
MRTEDARRLAETHGDAASSARAAEVVDEQRAARERLALMSASDEPTAPTPAVSGRPRKAAKAPSPTLALALPVDRLLRWGFALIAVFFVGVAGALLLARLH